MESTFYGGKTSFFRAKNLSVNTWRSGPDICSLICASPVAVLMHLHKEFGSKSFETRCWNEAAKYWNNLSKGTTAENLDQGEAKLRRMNSWQTCSSFLLCFSQIFLKLRTVTNCPSKMRLIRIVGPLYSHHLVQRVYEVLFQYLPNVFR